MVFLFEELCLFKNRIVVSRFFPIDSSWKGFVCSRVKCAVSRRRPKLPIRRTAEENMPKCEAWNGFFRECQIIATKKTRPQEKIWRLVKYYNVFPDLGSWLPATHDSANVRTLMNFWRLTYLVGKTKTLYFYCMVLWLSSISFWDFFLYIKI